MGPNGRPVPEALVQIRTSPHPTANDVRRGTFVKDSTYGSFAKTDAEGRLAVLRPAAPERFNVDVTTPGYGPYWAGWSSYEHDGTIPAHFIVELEAGWSVGGIIVDDTGKPVEGVRIRPSIEYKKPPGVTKQFGVGTNLKTDAAGKWRFDSVPVSMNEVYVEIDHPAFKPLRRPLPRDGFGLEPGQEATAKITLERGLTVVGKVTDEAGNPIAEALVRTKFFNDVREATTGPDGTYKLVGCEPRSTRIVVSAKGRATDMKELNVEPGMDPVDFQMKPEERCASACWMRKASPSRRPASSSSGGADPSSISSLIKSANTLTRTASGSGMKCRLTNSRPTSALRLTECNCWNNP